MTSKSISNMYHKESIKLLYENAQLSKITKFALFLVQRSMLMIYNFSDSTATDVHLDKILFSIFSSWKAHIRPAGVVVI